MSLKDSARGWLGIASAGLGVTRWGRVLAAMGVVAVLFSASGFMAGKRWERGAQAIADSKQHAQEIKGLHEDREQLVQAATTLKQGWLNAGQDYRTAARRLEHIADGYEQDREQQQAFATRQQRELEQLLADRPDLDAVDIGPGLLDHWNRANRGGENRAPADAAATDQRRPAAPVPTKPAGSQKRPAAAPAGQPRRGGAAIPRLRQSPAAVVGRGEGTAVDRLAVVLPSGGRAGLQGSRL